MIEKQNVDKDVKGSFNNTPLHDACWKGPLSIVEFLISKGAKIEENGNSLIHFASKSALLPIVQYLIEEYLLR